jgi:hypothetical protein
MRYGFRPRPAYRDDADSLETAIVVAPFEL